ncbi:MAG: LytTR family DNA-binding domain-containing protein [Anaerovoracaceae bacterium]
MLKIAICDDSLEEILKMESAVKEYFKSNDKGEYRLETSNNPIEFLSKYDENKGYDIVLLDICMPGMLGVEVAKDIRKTKNKTEIIFVTTSDEFAVDAFSLKATHYLMKPFTRDDFDGAMDRAFESIDKTWTHLLAINGNKGNVTTVDINRIYYIESNGHQLQIHTKDQAFLERKNTLSATLDFLKKTAHSQFISPYKGYIVNNNAIKSIERTSIILKNGISLPISRRNYKDIQDTYFDYIFGGGMNR